MRLSDRKIVIVTRKTRFEELVERYNTADQARFYADSLGQGADFDDLLEENRVYSSAISAIRATAEDLGRVQVLPRAHLPNFLFAPMDIVVTVGQDGLAANTLKYLSGQPLVAVNPDRSRIDGVLLPFEPSDVKSIVTDIIREHFRTKAVTLAQAALSDKQVIFAVNDLFIGRKSHVSARYRIRFGESEENHSSSGIVISTGLGSTGWLKSYDARAEFAWESDYLKFFVREPFPSNTTGTSIRFGEVSRSKRLTITSKMAESGVIFSDGVEQDYLDFYSGVTAEITIAQTKGMLVI